MERPDESSSPEASSPEASSTNDAPGLPTVAEALSNCVCEALERGEPTEVPGLGTFRVEHRPSQMHESAGEGQVSITPPREEIVFESVQGE